MNQAIIDSIDTMIVNGNRLDLPSGIMSNYKQVKIVLIKAGSKYNKSGFVFPSDAQVFKDRLTGGEKIDDKRKYQLFETPELTAQNMVDWLDVDHSHTVLEPSAGKGRLVHAVVRNCKSVTMVELNAEHEVDLEQFTHADERNLIVGDFLDQRPDQLGMFDRIIMNPPFTKGQDMKHIKHATRFLESGGVMVAIMSDSEKNYNYFNDKDNYANSRYFHLTEGTFKASGTMVKTAMWVYYK